MTKFTEGRYYNIFNDFQLQFAIYKFTHEIPQVNTYIVYLNLTMIYGSSTSE